MTKTRFVALVVAPAFLFLTGCGMSKSVTPNETQPINTDSANNTVSNVNSSGNDDVSGYVCSGPKFVMFIQYTNIGGQLTGTFYEDYEDSNNKFETYSSPITGEISGNSITINITNSGKTLSGNLSDGTLNLGIPQNDGTVQDYQFRPGTLNDFNQAVYQLQATVASDQAAQQRAQQTADLQQKLSKLESAVSSDIQAIQSDEQALENDVKGTEDDIKKEKQDLVTTQSAEQGVLKEQAGDPQTQMDANQVQMDANQVQMDDNQIQMDYNQFSKDESALKSDISALQSDFQNMNSVAAQLGVTVPSSVPSSSDVSQAVSRAESVVKSTSQTESSYISQSKKLVAAANDAANKAQSYANG